MSYIGGGMYDAQPCPACGAILWNHWLPKPDDETEAEEDAEDEP